MKFGPEFLSRSNFNVVTVPLVQNKLINISFFLNKLPQTDLVKISKKPIRHNGTSKVAIITT